VYNTDRVKESMLRGEKGAWAAHNLFGKILNRPPGKQIDKKTDRQTLEAFEPPGRSPQPTPFPCPARSYWPWALNSREHKTPFPSPVIDKPSELIYKIGINSPKYIAIVGMLLSYLHM
jgi:hypothetical protein